jgi:hypothetical protein
MGRYMGIDQERGVYNVALTRVEPPISCGQNSKGWMKCRKFIKMHFTLVHQ